MNRGRFRFRSGLGLRPDVAVSDLSLIEAED